MSFIQRQSHPFAIQIIVQAGQRLFAAALATSLVGCGPTAPPLTTWPVHGKVVDQTGRPVDNGVVRLMTDADPHLITVGPLDTNGAFEVRTQRQNFDYVGAVEGTYKALIFTSKKDAQGNASPVQYHVPQPVVVKPQANTLDLSIEL